MTELESVYGLLALIIPPILTYLLTIARKNPQIKTLTTNYKQVKNLFEEIESATSDKEISNEEFERIVERSREIINTHKK